MVVKFSNRKIIFCALLLFFIINVYVMPVQAQTDSDNNTNGGLNVSVQLRHRIVIPQIIYFRLGAAAVNVVDQVSFDVASALSLTAGNNQTAASLSQPLGNNVAVDATTNGTLSVDLRSNVGTVLITYTLENPNGLDDESGTKFIDYDQIVTDSLDPSGFPAPVLSNGGGGGVNGVQIMANEHVPYVVNRQSSWTYRYRNETIPEAGIYTGKVTYTAAAL